MTDLQLSKKIIYIYIYLFSYPGAFKFFNLCLKRLTVSNKGSLVIFGFFTAESLMQGEKSPKGLSFRCCFSFDLLAAEWSAEVSDDAPRNEGSSSSCTLLNCLLLLCCSQDKL